MIRIAFTALLSGAALLNVFLMYFGNAGLFPLELADFSFFAALWFFFALYRPGWAFLLFLSLLPFETVNLAPHALLLSVRPYQLVGGAVLLSLFLRFVFRRPPFSLVRLRWFDALPILFALGGFLSIFSAPDHANAGKQAVVALSFVALYFLSRQFLGDARDARRVIPFIAFSALLSALFALWQSLRFTSGLASFEVMSGRPNAFFPEPDWLGMFLIFSGSLALAFLFYAFEKTCLRKEAIWKLKSLRLSPDSLLFMVYFFGLTLSVLGLLLTVARSAWVGFALSALLFLKLLLVGKYSWHPREWRWKLFAKGSAVVFSSFLLALFSVWAFRLTTFELADRVGSTASGLQEITVSCAAPTSLPERIENVSELSLYGCRFIRLEEIDAEKNAGKFISTVLRSDPSIAARLAIREKTFETLKDHWLFGIGWGSIGSILGTDDRGASLNASIALLEALLGGGLISFLAFFVLWMLIPIFALKKFFFGESRDIYEGENPEARAIAVFFLVSWIGFTIFNLFNSGILLGFFWVWLGSIGMIAGEKK